MSEFNADFVSEEQTEPLHSSQIGQFDFEAVSEALGEKPEIRLDEKDFGKLILAVSALLDWQMAGKLTRKSALKQIGLRTVAMAWVLDPGRFSNDSLRTISKKLGFTAPVLSVLTAEFTRIFKVNNEFQIHDWRAGKLEPRFESNTNGLSDK